MDPKKDIVVVPEKVGVKETKEALIALVTVGKIVFDVVKDGVQLSDAMVLAQKLADPQVRKVLEDGCNGCTAIGAEIKDMSLAEVIELTAVVPDLLRILKA